MSPMSSMSRLVAAALSLSACSVPLGITEQEIINGTLAPDDHAVVLLAAYPQDRSTLFACTAVVVSPTALVTAAHCLDHTDYRYGVFYGADASAYPTLADLEPQLAAVTSVHVHPSYARTAPFTADIGMVVLAQPAPVAPLPFARAVPAAGVPARIIGFGQTTYGEFNAVRFQATTKFVRVDAGDTVTVGDVDHRTCIGDSGGPALVMIDGVETVIGVTSYADTTGCTDPAHFRRTDTYAAFIDQHAGTSPPPGPAPDPDPDPAPADDGGGCAAGGGGSLALSLCALIALIRTARSRRRPSAPSARARSATA